MNYRLILACVLFLFTTEFAFAEKADTSMCYQQYASLHELIDALQDRLYCISESTGKRDDIAEALVQFTNCAKALIQNGTVNVNEHEAEHGLTPAMAATLGGFDGILKLVIDNGANLDAKDNKGRKSADFLYLYRKSALNYFIMYSFYSLKTHEKCAKLLGVKWEELNEDDL